MTDAAKTDFPPNTYFMELVSQDEVALLIAAVNKGIDSRLEAITNRSTIVRHERHPGFFCVRCHIHYEEMPTLLRRFVEIANEEWTENSEDEHPGTFLTRDILYSLRYDSQEVEDTLVALLTEDRVELDFTRPDPYEENAA